MCILCTLEDFITQAPAEFREGANIARLVLGIPTRDELDADPNLAPDPETVACLDTLIGQQDVLKAVAQAMEWALNAGHDVASLTPSVFTALGVRIAQGYQFPKITPPTRKSKAQDGMRIELTMETLGIGMAELMARTAARIGEDREPVMGDLLETIAEIAAERESVMGELLGTVEGIAARRKSEAEPEELPAEAEPEMPPAAADFDHEGEITIPRGFAALLEGLDKARSKD